MQITRSKMTSKYGYLEGGLDCVDESIRDLPFNYKKRISNSFYAINGEDLNDKVRGENLYTSKKMDGQLQIIIYNGDDIFMIGRGGTVRTDLAVLETTKAALKASGASSMILAAELYVQKEERARVYDVIAALSNNDKTDTLGLAFFDLLEVNGESSHALSFEEIYNKLDAIFEPKGTVHIVETKLAATVSEVEALYKQWVEEEGGEGIVVRSNSPYIYKVKPKHTFDVVIVGYAEGLNERKGLVKSLLIAFINEDGGLQIGGKVGNFNTAERESFFNTLSEMHCKSSFIETDSDGIAFHMVEPTIVIEIGCNDVISENTNGKPLKNHVLDYSDDRYILKNIASGGKFIHPVFERIREDKSCNATDISFSQISSLVTIDKLSEQTEELPKSEILFREIYKKTVKEKIMLQKYVVWKTGKEKIDPRYSAYVMHYTDFSSGRKDPLKREVRISSSEEQIMQLTQELITKGVKKGWEKVE